MSSPQLEEARGNAGHIDSPGGPHDCFPLGRRTSPARQATEILGMLLSPKHGATPNSARIAGDQLKD